MSGILTVEIKKLFNKHNYSINFENKLNVLIGENGCGKSTIINLIYNLSKKDFVSLSKVDFEELHLDIDNQSIKIKSNDLKQLEISRNPDFRYNLFHINLNDISSFEEFYEKVLSLENKKYPYEVNKYEIYSDYLRDDYYYGGKDFVDFMSKYMIEYGSKLYLKCFYSFFKQENPFDSLDQIVSKVQLYSFVNIEETDELQIQLNDEQENKCIEYLDKYFKDKQTFFTNNEIFFMDKVTSEILKEKDLSSGERKIIKIIELIVTSGKNDFLLLDEPELSLSIYWQRFIIEDLIEHCEAKKIIVATQSPNLLTASELDYLIPIYSDECGSYE